VASASSSPTVPLPQTPDRDQPRMTADHSGPRRSVVAADLDRTESTDPGKEAKRDRIEEVTSRFLAPRSPWTSSGRCRSDPVTARAGLRRTSRPARWRATHTRTHGIRNFHACYSLGYDQISV
jgi:hypothetical protein